MSDDRPQPARAARQLLLSRLHAVLGTISLDVPGYPFGSLVPYVPDRDLVPVLLISRLAQHTKNLLADPRVSLTITGPVADDPQETERLTWLGRAEAVLDESGEMLEHVERFQPQARKYTEELDFGFYRLKPEKLRYIGGFGRIHWVDAAQVCQPSPFDQETLAGVLEHMNTDHVDALRLYCALQGQDCPDDVQPVMCGVDADGCHVRIGQRVIRVPFPEPVSNAGGLRQVLVELARTARA